MRARRIGVERRQAVGNRGQRLVLDLDGGGGILSQIAALGDDEDHQLAGVADLIPRQDARRQHLGDRALGGRRIHAAGGARIGLLHLERRLKPLGEILGARSPL